MADDPNEPVVLTTRPSESLAALIVAALKDHGVEAQATGGFTSGFRTEVPGEVRVLVRQADLGRAQQALREIEAGASDAS
jgi:hypothetical protein